MTAQQKSPVTSHNCWLELNQLYSYRSWLYKHGRHLFSDQRGPSSILHIV